MATTKRRATQYQYEPPVTPRQWAGDEERYAIRMAQLLDDIYNKYGQLRTALSNKSDGGIAEEVDPTVPDWAKQPTKPTYTAKDVGALALDTLYRVGDIYITTNSTSPAEIFGGTWERIEDRFLLAAGSTYAAGSTGGEASHTLTIDEMPSHRHGINTIKGAPTGNWQANPPWTGNPGEEKPEPNTVTLYAGGGAAHNNMPPYLAVYVWRRVA